VTPEPEQRLITRTWRTIALQTALVFAVALVALDTLAVALITYTAHHDARREVAQTVLDPDALTAPPAGIWFYLRQGGALRVSPGAAATPPDPVALREVAAGAPARVHKVRYAGREYLVDTARRGAATVQAALDLSDQEREMHRLYLGLATAGTAGVGLAALVGGQIARRAIRPLGQALARQHRFIADASHELRTPLTQLHTRAQLVARQHVGGRDPARTAEDIAQLVRGTRQLSELLEELLLAAQLRTEPQHFGPVDLAAVATGAAEAERPRAQEREVCIRTTVGPGPHTVRGIEPALRRVLTAMLDNAMGHTAAGGRIDVKVAGDADGADVTCTVRDNGVGFAPEEAHRLFERFARGPHARQHGDSRRFGLGLALVQEVVHAHGGRVTATGSPGEGAAFTITLPRWRVGVT
jgi:two-component system, OmpR family, sensor kinase